MTTFIFGGFMREQVCIYMCPWPRIQTAMMDEKSLLVTYRHWRGEPRGSLKQAQAQPGAIGDCIDCNQCVAVCPTGIDIREGPQIGCITCALCIDACDTVMNQIGRPRGLIDYVTFEDAEKEQAGGTATPVFKTLFRPRTLIYFMHLGRDRACGCCSRSAAARASISAPSMTAIRCSCACPTALSATTYTVKLRNMESRRAYRARDNGRCAAGGDVGRRHGQPRGGRTEFRDETRSRCRYQAARICGITGR
jgi:cytochrome c oxidase accessory protein FixG